MYAIVDIAGQQFKVAKDQKHFVHRLNAEVGDTVEFENVLLTDENGKITIGEPFVAGKKVTAKVLMQTRGEKVTVFKKKRRKGYRKSTGHRDYITQIQIEAIGTSKPKKAAKPAETTEETADTNS
jgi:large subunit ribosomal protein L21